jgi:hypothetical protein
MKNESTTDERLVAIKLSSLARDGGSRIEEILEIIQRLVQNHCIDSVLETLRLLQDECFEVLPESDEPIDFLEF